MAAAGQLNQASELLNSQLALAEAQVQTGAGAGAASTLRQAESVLASQPESRWRALALLAPADPQYLIPARQALDQVAAMWGSAAFRSYLARPDLEKLARPLLTAVSAAHR